MLESRAAMYQGLDTGAAGGGKRSVEVITPVKLGLSMRGSRTILNVEKGRDRLQVKERRDGRAEG